MRGAAVPPPLRAVLLAPGHAALLLHRLGPAGRMVRGTFWPFARRLTSDPQFQILILDAYASCYSKRTQVQMLRDARDSAAAAVAGTLAEVQH